MVEPLNQPWAKGDQGHDRFAHVVTSDLARRFPIENPGDNNSAPTGGLRPIAQRLGSGAVGWILRPGNEMTLRAIGHPCVGVQRRWSPR